MAKTAIDQAIDELNSKIFPPRSNTALGVSMAINVLKKYLEVEKEQIIHAWREGDNDSMYSPKELDKLAEQYYNETYKSE